MHRGRGCLDYYAMHGVAWPAPQVRVPSSRSTKTIGRVSHHPSKPRVVPLFCPSSRAPQSSKRLLYAEDARCSEVSIALAEMRNGNEAKLKAYKTRLSTDRTCPAFPAPSQIQKARESCRWCPHNLHHARFWRMRPTNPSLGASESLHHQWVMITLLLQMM